MKKIFFISICTLITSFIGAQNYQAGDHELAVIPTAYTMEKGQAYFTDWELFLINYTYAPTNKTHISFLSLFPLTTEFIETISLGIKHQYLNNENLKAALIATYTPKSQFSSIGTVFSFGENPTGLHLGAGILNFVDDDGDVRHQELTYFAGYRTDLSQRTSFMFEYANFNTLAEAEFNGMISLGFRFRTHNVTWDLSGIRPLESTGDFLFFPLLKATFLID